jgi:hypothetical protein
VAELLETGIYGTIGELARAERINPSYVSRVLRLTLLAPHIVEAVLDGRQSEDVTLATAMAGVPVVWEQQIRKICERAAGSLEKVTR